MDAPFRLLALPNEVVLKIVNQVSADCVDALALTCKHIKVLSEKRLELHRSLEREYSKIRLGANDSQDYRTPICFLYDLLDNPDIAYYPVSLKLAQYEPESWPGYAEHRDTCDSILREADGFHGCLSTNPLIPSRKVPVWHRAILRHDVSPIYALLLTLLPNLKKISYDGVALRARYIDAILQAVIRATAKKTNRLGALSKLESVKMCGLPRSNVYSHLRGDLAPATPTLWTRLPSLQSLNLDLERRISPPFMFEKLAVCEIKHLTVRSYRSSTSHLCSVFPYMPALKSFTFEAHELSDELVDKLEECYGNSLEKLDLQCEVVTGEEDVDSFRSFKTLKEIAVPECLFDDWFDPAGGKLLKILPPTIEVISLVLNDPTICWQMVMGIGGKRGQTALPALRILRVGVEDYEDYELEHVEDVLERLSSSANAELVHHRGFLELRLPRYFEDC